MNIRLVAILPPTFAAVLTAGPPPAAPVDVRPVCASASHAVLKVQAGRDVCAPTVLADGQAVSVGYLPTTCPPFAPDLLVDAVGSQDLCRPRPHHPPSPARG